jgi:putative ABC transport system ATP-binding protein
VKPFETIIKLSHVTKMYQEHAVAGRPFRFLTKHPSRHGRYEHNRLAVTAVRDFSLELREGEFSVIAGPSGSGKSTLMHLMSTLDAPTHGEIEVLGKHVTHMSDSELARFRLTELGFVFQAYNLIPVLSSQENVEYVLLLQGVPARQREKRAREALHWVGLSEMAHRRPDDLSGGQQQRVAVARALVHRPRLVLADEPTAHLDSTTGKVLLDLMRRLHDQMGITFVVTSHDPVVIDLADRLIEMRDGNIIGDKRHHRKK